jgi:hypothetical protein
MSGETRVAPGVPWIDANQRVLAAEFARLKAQLAGQDITSARQAIEEARATMPSDAAIDELATAFGLSTFERDLLLLCAGVEMDSGVAAQCAACDAAPGRRYATFALALAMLEDPHWSALTPVGPLRRWRLLDVKDDQALTTSRLIVDERVLHYLAGVNYLDPRLAPLLRARSAPAVIAAGQARIVESAARVLQQSDRRAAAVQFVGDDHAGQEDVAAATAAQVGLKLLVLRAADIPANLHEADALLVLWRREAALLGSALLVLVDHDDGHAAIAARWIERAGGVVMIAAPHALTLDRSQRRFTIDRPNAAEQKGLWTEALGPAAARLNGALDGVAAQFRLSTDTIVRIARMLGPSIATVPEPEIALWQACRSSVRGGLDALAQRLESTATWTQLILPAPQMTTLRQIATHVRRRITVYQEWGFAGSGQRGLGISALFSGESGTGKTMAAEVLGNELGLDLYRIDLASMVSKYIGETEKNLRRVFDAAEASGAILLFDEADALFGKRTDVKEGHDRYANIEVSYLLQRMEAYRGLAILTTNNAAALDAAFQRRLRFTIAFPFPDADHREQIWRGVFPARTPLMEIDYPKLARLNVAGGSIRNIAMNAAFLAAEANGPVRMSHLLHAARGEAGKRERPPSDAEIRGWV